MRSTAARFCLLLVAALLAGCGGDDPVVPSTTGRLIGTITRSSPEQINLSGATVAIYPSLDAFETRSPVQTQLLPEAENRWPFAFEELEPGFYYLDICLKGICLAFRSDESATASAIEVRAGGTTQVPITL